MERNKFLAVPIEDRISSLSLTPEQYMNELVPAQEDLSWTTPALPSHITSLTALRSLPLSEMVQTVLKEGIVSLYAFDNVLEDCYMCVRPNDAKQT